MLSYGLSRWAEQNAALFWCAMIWREHKKHPAPPQALRCLAKKNVKTFWVYTQYFFWMKTTVMCINNFDGKLLIACNPLNNI